MSEICAAPIVVTSLGKLDSGSAAEDPPVKNTFIHYDVPKCTNACEPHQVRRFRTDPTSEPRRFNGSPCCLDTASDSSHGQTSSTTSGSSTPRADDTTGSEGEFDEDPRTDCLVTTPMAFPCWMSKASLLPQSVPLALQTTTRNAFSGAVAQQPNSHTIPNSSTPYTLHDDGSARFGFKHRKASDKVWGISFAVNASQQSLVVNEVQAGGAMAAWNNQVKDGPQAHKQLLHGDNILSVNGKVGTQEMLEQLHGQNVTVEVLRPVCGDSNSSGLSLATQACVGRR